MKNPLYVVNKKKGIVEEAQGLFDYFTKLLNLDPAIQFFHGFIQSLMHQANAYVYLEMINEFLTVLIDKIKATLESLNIRLV